MPRAKNVVIRMKGLFEIFSTIIFSKMVNLLTSKLVTNLQVYQFTP